MKFILLLTTVYLVIALSASVAHSEQEIAEHLSSGSDVRLKRVKRKGGKGRGSSSRGSSKSKSRVPPADPYPKQPAYNPSYNPGGNAYPKQPGQTYPGQTGHAGQTGYGQHGYPGQTGYNNPGQTGYGQSGYGQTGHNYGQTGYGQNYGGLGGGGKYGKTKGGLGGLGTGLAGGAIGAAVGAYGGYKLGKMVGGMGTMGHYGYYNERHVYVKCDPPPRIETDPETNVTYIPRTVTYDARCDYYDKQPPRRHPYYYTNGQTRPSPTTFVTILFALISVVLAFGFDGVWQWQRPRSGYWLQS